MTRDGFSCILGFQNFSGEDPRTPLPDQNNMWFVFQSYTAQHKPLVKKWGFQLGSKNSKSTFYWFVINGTWI